MKPALAAAQAGTPLSGDVIVDSAANIQTDLDALEPLAAAGEISYSNFTDAGTPKLSVSVAQNAADAAAIAEFEAVIDPMLANLSPGTAAYAKADLAAEAQHWLILA